MKDFHSLFIDELKRAYSAENQIINAMPSIVNACSHKKLKDVLSKNLEESKKQMGRLDTIAKELNTDLSGEECQIVKSLINEVEKVLQSDLDPDAKDAALIVSLQRIEHYEIATYGALKHWAKHLKLENVEKLLEASSKEEGDADKKLVDVALGSFLSRGVNVDAMKRKAA